MSTKASRIAELEALYAKQLAKAEATKARLNAAKEAEEENASVDAVLAGLPEGTEVTFTFGRGEKVRQYTGKVVGSKPGEKGGIFYRARVNEGTFDEAVLGFQAPQVVSHNYVPTPATEPDYDSVGTSEEFVAPPTTEVSGTIDPTADVV